MNKAERVELLLAAEKDPKLQQVLIEKCRRDPVFFFDAFCFTFDPRKEPSVIPFELYPFQQWCVREWVQAIHDQVDVRIEKSRDMGVSWLVALLFLYLFLFFPGYNTHIGSRKEEFVDKRGDMSTVFEKIRFTLSYLPTWMQPKGFNPQSHDSHMKLINPENGNSITGESANPSFSRSGRYRCVFFDELAFWDFADAAWAAASQSTRCRISNSTPYGETNAYAQQRKTPGLIQRTFGDDTPPEGDGIRNYTLHWSLHPEKDEAWYEREKKRMTPDVIARELDINYSLSVSGKVFSAFKRHKHVTEKMPPVNYHRPVYRIWDFGATNATLWIQQSEYGVVRPLHERVLSESTTIQQVDIVLAESERLFQDCEFIDVCDPSGSFKDGKGESTHVEILQRRGGVYPLYSRILELPTKDRKARGRGLIEKSLQGATAQGEDLMQIYVSPDQQAGCPILLRAFEGGYRYKRDRNGVILDVIEEEHPYEDVIDNLIYFFLEIASLPMPTKRNTQPRRGAVRINPYTRR